MNATINTASEGAPLAPAWIERNHTSVPIEMEYRGRRGWALPVGAVALAILVPFAVMQNDALSAMHLNWRVIAIALLGYAAVATSIIAAVSSYRKSLTGIHRELAAANNALERETALRKSIEAEKARLIHKFAHALHAKQQL